MKRINKIFVTIISAGILLGCNETEFLDVKNPNELDAQSYYSNIENFNGSLNAVYSAIKSVDLYGQAFFNQTLLSLPHTADYWNAQCRNEVVSTDGWVNSAWRGWYRVISRANDIIENAPNFEATSPTQGELDELDLIVGQAHFLRAFAYFHLVRLWGEGTYDSGPDKLAVPLSLKVAKSKEDMEIPRSSVKSVYDQIVTDFETARQKLPESWDSDNIARATSWAATGFLAKVHLWMGQESTAKTYLESVFGASQFSLVPFATYDDLFQGKNEFSSESLYELNYVVDMQQNIWENGLGSGLALEIGPPGTDGWSNCHPHGVNIFRFGTDPRLQIATYAPDAEVTDPNGNTVEAGISQFNYTGHSFRKYVPQDYSVLSTNRNSGTNVIIMRLADLYLLYAEILNNEGQDVMASEYMNKIRRRAYGFNPELPEPTVDYTGLAGTQLRDSIREERFRELFAEGHRWYDITRWGIAEEEAMKYNEFNVTQGPIIFDAKDYYYPVPLSEIDTNPAAIPSTGY